MAGYISGSVETKATDSIQPDKGSSRLNRRAAQFVVGGYVVESQRVLLMWHSRLDRWVPPGGRIAMSRGEYPHEAVIRGVKAECGLDISIGLTKELVQGDNLTSPVPSPVAMQEIRLDSGEYYLDMVYFCRRTGGSVILDYHQAQAYHWFDSSDLHSYPLVPHIRRFAHLALDWIGEEDAAFASGQ
jgi:ADP-ribose pyrophosphatase YjhB (NUDIX family)